MIEIFPEDKGKMLKFGFILGALALAFAESNPCPKNLPSTCECSYYSLGGDVDSGSTSIICTKLDETALEDVVGKLSGITLFHLGFLNCNFFELKDNVFMNLSVENLDIENTPVDKIGVDAFAGIKMLTGLNIINSKVKNMPHLKHVSRQLISLIVDYSEITELYKDEFSDLVNLTELSINNNNIQTIEDGVFHGMLNLKEVHLRGNNISEIGNWFDDKNYITDLDLRGNNFNKIPKNFVQSLKTFSLRYINLNNNGIQSVEDGAFNGMKMLFSVELRGNKITKIGNWFDPNNIVEQLDLSDNNIEVIPETFIPSLRMLMDLGLEENDIETFTQTSLSEMIKRPHTNIYLKDNKIVCDKKLCWLYDYVDSYMNAHIEGDCKQPEGLRGIPFNSVITNETKMRVNC